MENINKILKKANYCESCVIKPCQIGCPLHNDITGFIKLVKEEKYKEAYELSCKTTVLQSVCGRVCPHERQCQGSCVKGISFKSVDIGNIEFFLGDMAIENYWDIPMISQKGKGKKVAIIGGGPSGITCAAFLARNGYSVTIFEKHDRIGGILYYGIPEFRLSKDVLKNTIEKILKLGIKVKLNYELKDLKDLEKIESEFDAIYLSIGSNLSTKMNIEGEELQGVYGANELLEEGNHPDYKGKKVAVIGGGNVAIDVARIVKQLNSKNVTIIYRRALEQMPAEKKEVKCAKDEGINFLMQNNIVRILGDKKVEKIECVKTELIKKDGDDRLSPVNIEGSNYLLDMDFVIMAVGSKVDDKLINKLGLEISSRNRVKVDKYKKTNKEKIFAGGDVIGDISTVAGASASGRKAANAIMEYLDNIMEN